MTTSRTEVQGLMAELQSLPAFKCIDFQVSNEDDALIVRATVGSAYDRARLLDVLSHTLEASEYTHFIQIDPLLNTPFSPTMPCHSDDTLAHNDWSQIFFVSGLQFAEHSYKN